MVTIKGFTSLEQSRKLAKILPLESADMNYWCGTQIRIGGHKTMDKDLDVPAWSLAALLDALPYGIIMNKDSQNSRYHFSSTYIGTYVTADNPVDACYELIICLNELNLL